MTLLCRVLVKYCMCFIELQKYNKFCFCGCKYKQLMSLATRSVAMQDVNYVIGFILLIENN